MSDFELVEKGPCPNPECGSSDACAKYDDGHAYCFSCGQYFDEAGEPSSPPKKTKKDRPGLITGLKFQELVRRKIREETCRKYGYGVGKWKGETVQVAPYHDSEGTVVAQKVRTVDKDFSVTGDPKGMRFFGQHLWRHGGKRVVITEGEIDCLSVAQALGLSWPVVSVPNGAQGALKTFKQELEWLESYDEVVIWFDNDEPGRKAAKECAEILSPGKVKIVRVESKDANEMLVGGDTKAMLTAVWEAKTYRPDGIVDGREITFETLTRATPRGYDTQYPGLNRKTRGIRKGELILFTAGTGIGKSTIVRELGYHLNTEHRLTLGNVFLEESYTKTAQAYVALDNNVPLGNLRSDPSILTREQWNDSLNRVINNGRTFFYNHFGSLESDNLLSKLRYMAVSLSCDFILLDHISIVVSGMESSKEGERKDLDMLMTRLRALIEETGVGVIAIAHLSKAQGGKAHEEGGRVSLNDLRGSAALKQIPDTIIALERDQQSEESDQSDIRILKSREYGETGVCDTVVYDHETGRLKSIEDGSAEF